MQKVISMINWKGGVGKSTLSLHLGVNIMRQSPGVPKVLLIDLDPQCNLSYLSLGVSKYIDDVYNKNQPTLKNIFDSYFNGKVYDTSKAIISQPITASPGHVWSNVDILPSHHELVLIDMRLAREKKKWDIAPRGNKNLNWTNFLSFKQQSIKYKMSTNM